MATENKAPEANERDIVKPMDNHTPIAAPGLGKKKAPRKPGEMLPADNHTPIINPR
ncbi:hypothetical protein O1L44_19300 [Streptomyces noursei]|uniref:SsmA n=2 Tax=Streptomyces TaxID=1883 RepID=Q9XCZ0_STRNR|nr:hypothetical protein [Streptomyces yunnanensis]AAD41469.1 SsmA [Streptomyces noursei ATCC 11455]ANZ18019.1 hypothetical protein SNOUR_23750 [Streptomyces noursei ATCC 11455]MCZ0994836.1 hypothetical protein [Streptomyces noursei]WEB42056.1 hypothetical protein MOV08_24185 [Streptomyces yunnanensis]